MEEEFRLLIASTRAQGGSREGGSGQSGRAVGSRTSRPVADSAVGLGQPRAYCRSVHSEHTTPSYGPLAAAQDPLPLHGEVQLVRMHARVSLVCDNVARPRRDRRANGTRARALLPFTQAWAIRPGLEVMVLPCARHDKNDPCGDRDGCALRYGTGWELCGDIVQLHGVRQSRRENQEAGARG